MILLRVSGTHPERVMRVMWVIWIFKPSFMITIIMTVQYNTGCAAEQYYEAKSKKKKNSDWFHFNDFYQDFNGSNNNNPVFNLQVSGRLNLPWLKETRFLRWKPGGI